MVKQTAVTRFAPSPTGFLHIGGARTALFNWLYARHCQGVFRLRIEDTDRERSTDEAVSAILDGLSWLGLDHDGEIVRQSGRQDRHRETASAMLASGTAYRCYSTSEEIAAHRARAKAAGDALLFRSPWRDADSGSAPDRPYVVRLKSPSRGAVEILDRIRGSVSWRADTVEDLVLLRSDGTPTYNLAVVVDDHDMGVTHVIRGDDHLSNAGKQALIYAAMGWHTPEFAHIPLIHGPDGRKLSKRHGALAVGEYRDMGYQAAAMRNYLARLGWSHGNDELFTTDEAVAWFGLDAVGKAPSRFDFKKLDNVSAHHIRTTDASQVVDDVLAWIRTSRRPVPSEEQVKLLRGNVGILRGQAKRLPDILERATFLLSPPAPTPADISEKLSLREADVTVLLSGLAAQFEDSDWTSDGIDTAIRSCSDAEGEKPATLFRIMRLTLAGDVKSPSVSDMLAALGKEESRRRIQKVLKFAN